MRRIAVVTGAASGMGLAVARRLAAAGHDVAIFDVDGNAADAAAEGMRAGGSTVTAAAVDVSDRTAVREAVDHVRDQLGPVQILVTSAGIEAFERVADITPESWERMLAVNLTGTFHCIQAVVNDMVEAGWGRIVTISSSSAQSGARHMAHYVASKAGVIGLTKALALDLAPHGITVNTIPPGFIDTPMVRRSVETGGLPSVEEVAARVPVRRAGTPEDVAAACSFLCSEEAGYITGQAINLNGGLYL